jgi:hypothetical protein
VGFLDKFKGKDAEQMVNRVKDEVAQRDEEVDAAIDKVADLADRATDGKFTEKIDDAAAKLKEAAERLDDEPKA